MWLIDLFNRRKKRLPSVQELVSDRQQQVLEEKVEELEQDREARRRYLEALRESLMDRQDDKPTNH